MTKVPDKVMKNFTEEQVRKIANFCSREFGLMNFTNKIQLEIRIFDVEKTSFGGMKNGIPVLCISIPRLEDDLIYEYREYRSIANLKYIGNIDDATWEEYVTALICHEMAHVIDYMLYSHSHIFLKERTPLSEHILQEHRKRKHRVHGTPWRKIYYFLRSRFVGK